MRRQALAGVEDTLGSLQAASANGGADAVSEALRDLADNDENGLAVGFQDARGSSAGRRPDAPRAAPGLEPSSSRPALTLTRISG